MSDEDETSGEDEREWDEDDQEKLAEMVLAWGYQRVLEWLVEGTVRGLMEDGVSKGDAARSLARELDMLADELSRSDYGEPADVG